jgi:hypothetical protein
VSQVVYKSMQTASDEAQRAASASVKLSWMESGSSAREQIEARAVQAREEARLEHCRLLREIFGNPFRPPAGLPPFVLAWNERTVLRIVHAIDEEEDFERMPILGDALEEAGCSDQLMIDHCHQAEPHVAGCWVLDRLLARP